MMTMTDILSRAPIIPVLSFRNVDEAVGVSRVLVEEGLSVLEITLRHESALDCIGAVSKALGDRAVVGAGTVMTPELAVAARKAGAAFGVSPGLTDSLAKAVIEMDWPFLPGIATVSEAMRAVEHGFQALKFFPAEASGGPDFLKGIGAVLPDVMFCPTGGITPGNAVKYHVLNNVQSIGGSWLASRDNEGHICLKMVRMKAIEAVKSAL